MITRRAFLSTAAMAGTVASLGIAARWPAFAQPYPSSVIRIVVPYSASTPPDILARIVAAALSDGEGWNVIVENKPGGVMTIGITEVLKTAGRRPHAALYHRSVRRGPRLSFPMQSSSSRPIWRR